MKPNAEESEAAAADPRRSLPSVDRLAARLRREDPGLPAWCATAAARREVGEARTRVERGDPPGDLVPTALAHARALARPRPGPVVNATGVVLHTNLGRAVLGPEAADAVARVAVGYSDVEFDLASGERGDRLDGISEMLVALSGAEAALAVNNNAAALLLALAALARGREVVVSRGELVEIGGSFRVPEILEQAGVQLREVGTTNRTHARDYREALGPQTGMLLKVHRSNFAQSGFVAETRLAELVAIGRERGVPVVEDLGSATLLDLRAQGLPDESYAPARLRSGVDLVCFSGDKLLGGPQAGIVLGRAGAVRAMRRSPLARALRLDKLSLAALDANLRAQLEGRAASLPTVRQLTEEPGSVEKRAGRLAERLSALAGGRLEVALEPCRAPVGGGSLPGFTLDSWAAALHVPAPGSADALCAALRRAEPPVLGRVAGGAVLLDARTLAEDDLAACEAALATVLQDLRWRC